MKKVILLLFSILILNSSWVALHRVNFVTQAHQKWCFPACMDMAGYGLQWDVMTEVKGSPWYNYTENGCTLMEIVKYVESKDGRGITNFMTPSQLTYFVALRPVLYLYNLHCVLIVDAEEGEVKIHNPQMGPDKLLITYGLSGIFFELK